MREDPKSANHETDPAATDSKIGRGERASAGNLAGHGDGASRRVELAKKEENEVAFDARRQAVSILQLGCDRETAARVLGFSYEQFNRAAESDANFARELSRAEAAAEITHMRSVQLAAQDPKNWRTSVWWLERMRPEVYRPRKSDAGSKTKLAAQREKIVEMIAAEVSDEEIRERLLARLQNTKWSSPVDR